MIRFCDSEVGCAEYSLLDRGRLLSYFLSGHLREIVCVYDGSCAEDFVGIITYSSLLYAVSVNAAIVRDYVILDRDIWQSAREIFKKRGKEIRDTIPLPVLDRNYQLICFAYQDEDANREMRMLRELEETQGVLQFADVFPEYKCVKINGFNELAYFFAKYLKDQGIQVQVNDAMWQDFFNDGECLVPEYECLNLYAEGTWDKPRDWKENLLRSVSVEFDCIDKIYEANIKKNLIKNAETEYSALFKRLQEEKEIVLCGIDKKSQDAYDFLMGSGIEACCFAVEELKVEYIHKLFGKKIITISEAMSTYQNPVFIDCVSQYSAWGLGNVDYFDYIGYRRNEGFILLKDYVEIPENNLLNVLKDLKVVLVGDHYLCSRLYEYLKKREILAEGYLQTLQRDSKPENMPEVLEDAIREDVLCILIEPVYRSDAKEGLAGKEEKNQRVQFLRKKGIDNYTDYFSDLIPFIHMEQDNRTKYSKGYLKPKRIVIGSILPYNGNVFFRSLLDSHPHILSIYYCDLNNQLFWICMRLSMVCAENILPLFWEMIEGNEESITNRSAFVEKMEKLLAGGSGFTSQELFVMFHIAYMYMKGWNLNENDINSMVLYWEPHFQERDKTEECVKWLETADVPCDIINIVRNAVPQKGSTLKEINCINGGVRAAYCSALRRMPVDKREYMQKDRLVIKFEDLKCKPKEILMEICNRWGVPWSDTLMQTTKDGVEYVYGDTMQRVSGFDLRPVYNIYDNFFSELDRLKIMLMDAIWQKRYGYVYAEPDWFTRRELQEIFLKKFCFEDPGDTTGFYKDSLELDNRITMQNDLRHRAQEVRCMLSMWESVF